MKVFGHRGAPGYPRVDENTMRSFRKALQYGADGIEFDVRRCGDGQIVVVHDDTVSAFTYDALKELEIPRLVDVLDQLGGKCLLNIELKESGLADDVKKLVSERQIEPHVIVSAFDWPELATFPPEIRVALLTSEREPNVISAARELHAAAIHPRKDIASPMLITAAHAANLLVHVWTVNDPAEIAHFRELGADAIFTDFPERCSTPAS